jgi:hypothetical protein
MVATPKTKSEDANDEGDEEVMAGTEHRVFRVLMSLELVS